MMHRKFTANIRFTHNFKRIESGTIFSSGDYGFKQADLDFLVSRGIISATDQPEVKEPTRKIEEKIMPEKTEPEKEIAELTETTIEPETKTPDKVELKKSAKKTK